ncbi:MAG: OmpA family protein [Deltaproteobacteria bacterium]|jgi:OOP family OmpA-OmpF porin
MKTKHDWKGYFFIMMGLLLIGCAIQKPQTPFQPQALQAGGYSQKVDNFLVILDASGSMAEHYKGESKLDYAKEIVSRMNQTIPDLKLTGGLREFSPSLWSGELTSLVYGQTAYTKAGLEGALQQVKRAGGHTPLAVAIDAAGDDLASARGDIALIVVGDGEHGDIALGENSMDRAPVVAAENLKSLFGDRLCIYAVQVGDSPTGKWVMEQVARAGQCGFMANADDIASADGMADFVEKVFFAKVRKPMDSDGDGVTDDLDQCPNTPRGVKVDARGCPLDTDGDGVPDHLDQCPDTPKGVKVDKQGCPIDTDGDGVPDYLDECPDTPKGATVNSVGCWALKGVVLFDVNKSELKPAAYPLLDEVVSIMKKNPDIRGFIEGHTDSTGPAAYNQQLSEKRARSVEAYIETHGIDRARFSVKGYGESKPIAPNDTPEGRQENRRVELRRTR